MPRLPSRRSFIAAATGSVTTLVLGRPAPAPALRRQGRTAFPRQDPGLVRQVVQFAHFDPVAVRELVSSRPALARASWDWGFGDWETPLGAASHVGRKDIADFLLHNGARPNLFTFAMLGNVDTVRAILEGRPELKAAVGPHGLSLLHHARAGGADSAVVAYLEELGGADPKPVDLPLSAEERAGYLGDYQLTGRDGSAFAIIERRDHIAFRYADDAPRDLLNQGDHTFHPVGAEAVRFEFAAGPRGVTGVTIEQAETALSAERIR